MYMGRYRLEMANLQGQNQYYLVYYQFSIFDVSLPLHIDKMESRIICFVKVKCFRTYFIKPFFEICYQYYGSHLNTHSFCFR